MSVFEKYAAYYNLLYRDKDYIGEANYIDSLIKRFQPGAKTILDLGCGTGKHASLLAQKGYQVQGVDRSDEMLFEAKKLVLNSNLNFSQGDIRTIRLQKSFDIVISLFHVMSYQTTNQDLEQSILTVFEHLNPGGIFIFDCWYGPAVLTDHPVVRVKRLENELIRVIRIAEPLMDVNKNTVDVNYHILIRNKANGLVDELTENHKMRYFFQPELVLLLNQKDFTLISVFEFMTNQKLGCQTWNACFIARKN